MPIEVSYFLDLLALSLVIAPAAYIVGGVVRKGLMLFLCLVGLYYLAPRLLVFFIVFWLAVAILVQLLQRVRRYSKFRVWFFCTTLLALGGILLLFKSLPYQFWVQWNVAQHYALGLILPAEALDVDLQFPILLPVGLSFALFRAADLLIKVFIGKLSEVSFLDTLHYGLFAPVLVAGPVIEFEETQDCVQLAQGRILFVGFWTVVMGFFKIFFLAQALKDYATLDVQLTLSQVRLWQLLLVHPWYFYFNFSGYTDVAIGLGALYGYKLKPNFMDPYLQRNLQFFWANWHMSLTRFAQRNVFIPLGGFRKRTEAVALLCTMLLIAFWHDLSWALLAFGLYHAFGLIVLRHMSVRQWSFGLARLPSPLHRVVSTAFTFVYVALSFPLLELSVQDALAMYLKIFSLHL